MKIRAFLLLLPFLLVAIPSAQARGELKVPWSLGYSDGSANGYHFGQDSKGGPVTYEYLPVRPENSSTGTYSGGEPRQGRLDAKQAAELQKWLGKLESDKSLHQESRDKGTGSFTLKSGDDTRRFIVQMSPTLQEFDAFLKGVRNSSGIQQSH